MSKSCDCPYIAGLPWRLDEITYTMQRERRKSTVCFQLSVKRHSICDTYYLHNYVNTTSLSKELRLKQSKFSIKNLRYKLKFGETSSKDCLNTIEDHTFL